MHKYALQFIDSRGDNMWVDTTVEEMKKFIDFMFLMRMIYNICLDSLCIYQRVNY